MPENDLEPNPDRIERWLFTLDRITGEVYKVEKLDSESGQKHEISEGEYSALSGYLEQGQSSDAPVRIDSKAPESAGGEPYELGYYQGLADYEAAVLEAAYLQGIADCAALLG